MGSVSLSMGKSNNGHEHKGPINNATFSTILWANNAQQNVIELIKQHRAKDAYLQG